MNSREKYCVMHAQNQNASTITIAASFNTLKEAQAWMKSHTAPWGVYRIRYPF